MNGIFLKSTRRGCAFSRCLAVVVAVGILAAAADGATLTGTVLGPDESPVSGVVVETGSLEAVTDEAGAFRLTGLDTGKAIVRLRGDAGEGRVAVTLGDDDTAVVLNYPVITTVVLLHDNDTHFNFNQREAFEAEVNAIRARYANVFLLSAGDIFVRHADRWAEPGDISYYEEMCAYMIDIMNDIGYDVCTLGNHELFYLDHYTREALERARFPLLAANIGIETDKLPPVKPYVIFETQNELSIAVLGITRSNERPGVETLDFIETARAYEQLADEHDLFVALTHIGLSRDRALAEAMPELDVIIGGHTNHLLEEGERVNGVLVTMAGGPPPGHQHQVNPEWPKYLGKIRVIFENDRIIDKTARVMTFEAEVVQTAP